MELMAKIRERSLLNMTTPASVRLEHLSPTIGTVIHGIDLNDEIDTETFNFIDDLFIDRKVIFFRNQDVSVERHMEICRWWGELEIISFLPQHETHEEVLHIKRDKDKKSTENIWHSDVTWREKPSLGSMLRAVAVPDVGGDTLWADMHAAYDGLPDHIKRACEGLSAVHSITNSLGVYVNPDKMHAMAKEHPPAVHPVIRVHPVTGRNAIFVNRAHTVGIKGLSRRDSEQLMEILCHQANTPEYQCRFRWEPNSIAFWDNRSTQHYAAADYYPKYREMYRVTVVGDKPV